MLCPTLRFFVPINRDSRMSIMKIYRDSESFRRRTRNDNEGTDCFVVTVPIRKLIRDADKQSESADCLTVATMIHIIKGIKGKNGV